MSRLILCIFMISTSLLAQEQPSPEKIKKDVDVLQMAVNDAVNKTVPGFGVLQGAKGTYLDGYGVVVTVEVALEPPRNPFSGLGRTANEVRTLVNQRRKDTVENL